jgi:hypothetical protein
VGGTKGGGSAFFQLKCREGTPFSAEEKENLNI